jgi:putative membrane protein insertion efficiency factor
VILSAAIRFLIRVYQYTLGTVLPGSCRFQPTCSQYALEAVAKHGAAHGIRLAMKRILRCHPWGGCGHDPVPEKN